MGRVLFVTWHGGGNVNPVVALGRQLQTLGHEVTVLASASLAARFERVGLAFERRDPTGEWDLGLTAAEVAATCDRLQPDAVVVDYMLPAALCATEALDIPTVALVHTLYGALLEDGTVSPMSMAATVGTINRVREDLGLAPITRLGELLERVAHIVVTAPATIDTPPDPLPANVAYVGPVFEDADPGEPWNPPPGSGPLIVVSLGTTDMDELPLLARVLGALAHENARVLATVGDHADPWELPTPGNATVTRFVQHAAVLPHADLVISHGGIGTCLAALAHGLPVLCLPIGRDQPVNAAALARTGAAKVLPSTATPKQIAVAVDELLREPSFREAARQVAASMPPPGDEHPATTLIAGLLG